MLIGLLIFVMCAFAGANFVLGARAYDKGQTFWAVWGATWAVWCAAIAVSWMLAR